MHRKPHQQICLRARHDRYLDTTSPRSVNLIGIADQLTSTWRRRPGSDDHVIRYAGINFKVQRESLSTARKAIGLSAESSSSSSEVIGSISKPTRLNLRGVEYVVHTGPAVNPLKS